MVGRSVVLPFLVCMSSALLFLVDFFLPPSVHLWNYRHKLEKHELLLSFTRCFIEIIDCYTCYSVDDW